MTAILPPNVSKSMAIRRPTAKTVRATIVSACAAISRAVTWAAHLQAVVLHPAAVQVHRLPAAALQAAPAAAANAIILQIAVPSITVILKPVGK